MEPKIRKSSFRGDWDNKTLSELLTISTEKNKKGILTKDNVLSVSDESGVVNQIKFLGRSYAGNKLTGYKIFRKNQIAYTKSPLKSKPFGIFKVNNNQIGIVSVLYGIYDVNDNVYPKFIDRYFEPAFRTNKYLLPLINKGAKNTINISDETAISGKINIPRSFDEQTAICEYLDKLDLLIQMTTKKIESLKQIKTASLQSMFPQEGEKKPRVRFKGFEGDWDCVEFGSIITECLDKTTSENEDVLLSSAICGLYLNSELFTHFRGQSNIGYKKVKKNMLILSAQNLHLGNANVNLRFESGIVSPAYKIYYINNCNSEFLAHWIKREETKLFFLMATTSGASVCRKNIVWKDLYRQTLLIPKDTNEQQVIAKYFTIVNSQIDFQTQRLEKLKQIKSACLENMFV